MTDTRSVADRLATITALDHTGAHAQILERKAALARKLYAAFDVTHHPSATPYRTYGTPTGLRGAMAALSGGGLDWVIDSWIANPERGFSNHHLTVWLPPTVKVPHFGFAIGTIPELFCYLDLVPRADLWVDTAELDRYHAVYNQRLLEVTRDPRFKPFISQEIYIREALSPIGLCVTTEVSREMIDHCFDLASEQLDRWIGWVKDAPSVPAADRSALARRDRFVRRTICERDPANIIAERLLGKELTESLVQVMWGAAPDPLPVEETP
jgi:hypothetical protein